MNTAERLDAVEYVLLRVIGWGGTTLDRANAEDLINRLPPPREMPLPKRSRRFELHRDSDESGVSGTGVVAEGVEFCDGTAALRWRTEYRSTAVYGSMEELEKIHGHNGATRVVWVDA